MMEMLAQYVVLIVMGISLAIGYIIKHSWMIYQVCHYRRLHHFLVPQIIMKK